VSAPALNFVPTITVMADGYELLIDRPDLANVGDLWGRGWSIIPLWFRGKTPSVRSWTEYQRRRPTFEEIEAWFGPPTPRNVGVITGTVSGLVVVDADSPEAFEWATANMPPCDMRVRTAKGVHLYYAYTGKAPIRNKVRATFAGKQLEIDVRGEGGYVVGPGSVHESGHIYTREGAGW
jgi:putative DNA primase/helicase